MNSLRPLATISLLGIVGLFLYMKINETEPVVPADAMEWDLTGDLNIGAVDVGGNGEVGELEIGGASTDPSVQVSSVSPATTAAPVYSTSTAPAYSTATVNEAPPAFQPNTTEAPPFAATPEPSAEVAIDSAVETSETSVASTTPETESTKSSKLPPLPALPVVAAAAVANEAMTDSASESNAEVTTPAINTPAADTPVATQERVSTNTSVSPSFTAQEPAPSTESLGPENKSTAGQASLFSATRLAVQSALDRGELSQALLLLSDWYGDPSLSSAEATEVQELLGQLAGSVIYSTEHRLEPPYMVQAGEKLEDIAQKYNVPWQLLAKINGIASPDQLQPGQQLKVVRGPFSARIDLGKRKMVLMLDRRYAGQFPLDIEPATSIEEGYWSVNQKLLTPGNVGAFNAAAGSANEERSILLTNTASATGQVAVLRGPGATTPTATDPPGRVIQFKGADVNDVYDILSLGSQVIIRR